MFFSSSAFACRGTVEYPEVYGQLEASTIAPDRLEVLSVQLSQGQAIHEEGHRVSDMEKMAESLRILDAIKQKIGG